MPKCCIRLCFFNTFIHSYKIIVGNNGSSYTTHQQQHQLHRTTNVEPKTKSNQTKPNGWIRIDRKKGIWLKCRFVTRPPIKCIANFKFLISFTKHNNTIAYTLWEVVFDRKPPTYQNKCGKKIGTCNHRYLLFQSKIEIECVVRWDFLFAMDASSIVLLF